MTELDTLDPGEAPLRINEQRFLNDDVFVRGLLTEATMYELHGADRVPVRGSTVTWGFRDVTAVGADFDANAPVDPVVAGALVDTHTVGSRGRSIAPLMTSVDEYWYDDGRTFEQRSEYEHDGRGNVLVERDLGAPDDALDDLTTEITYSDCLSVGDTVNGCLPQSSSRQPFWSPGTCVNWASYPTKVSVTGTEEGAAGALVPVLLRERVSANQMCDNGAPTVLDELVSNEDGSKTYATTNVTLNQYGDAALVMAPPGANGVRYTVRYRYDADRNSDIASVEEFDVPGAKATAVLTSGELEGNSTAGIVSSATFDPLSGRVASRTDANGATRSYVYDEHGRIVETSTMATPTSTSTPLITYEYHANDPGYGYAIAHHVDGFGGRSGASVADAAGGDTTETIDTITFVDGLGRVRQTKRDARLSVGGAAPVDTRQVTDGVGYDQLARPLVQYGATADGGPATSFSRGFVAGAATVTEWFSYDLPASITEPGDRTTTYDYPWVSTDDGPLLAWTVATDPEGRVTTVGQDVRDVQRLHIDSPAPRFEADGTTLVEAPPDLVTQYRVDSLGQLLEVKDSTGALTEYRYDLTGRTIRATTPNGGTVRTAFDLAGNQRESINEAMAAIGERTTYRYRFDRLVAIDEPGTVDDVTYEYGLDNDDGRFTAGRISHIEDRARLVDNTYDRNGAVVEQTAVIKRHNWKPTLTGEELAAFSYTTRWSYDDLGRIATIGYPDAKTVSFVPDGTGVGDLTAPDQLAGLLAAEDLDGETVTYDYDAGGLLRSVEGEEEGIELVAEEIAPDIEGNVATVQVPRRTTHRYAYLNDRIYEPRLLAVRDEMGNGTTSDYSFDVDTRWLESKRTTAPNADPAIAERVEVQDLSYNYDIIGRPLTYDNDLPLANRAINGGAVQQQYAYDGFGRVRSASGTFDLKAGEQQRYRYGVDFTPAAPWSVVAKEQRDELVTTKGKASTKVNDDRTYSFERALGTATGPLQAVSDRLTVSGETNTYDYRYNPNGDVTSMLAQPKSVPTTSTTTTAPKGKGKPTPTTTVPGPTTTTVPAPSEANVWDRKFTWTLNNQLTSASDGSELHTFAYGDTGALVIQDGNLLTRDGEVISRSGGGPETIFLNPWVTVRSQKIYKHVSDGIDTIVTQMDSDGGYETKQMFLHTDVVGSTNVVTDVQGRGFQRHEYFPSGEIWINDHKEEIRTPFQFADGYYEEEFDLVLFGARWYDVERELFLSPDPLLSFDVQALIDQPGLGGAYTYGGANPVGNVDPTGFEFFSGHQAAAVKARAQEAFEAELFVLEISGEGDKAAAMRASRIKDLKTLERAEAVLEPEPIISIDLVKKKVSVGAPYGPRKEWKLRGGDGQSAPDDDATGGGTADSTNGAGGPDAGGSGPSPGGAVVDLGDTDDAGSTGGDDAPDEQPPPRQPQRGATGADDVRGDS